METTPTPPPPSPPPTTPIKVHKARPSLRPNPMSYRYIFVLLCALGTVYVFILSNSVTTRMYRYTPGPMDIALHRRTLHVNDTFYMHGMTPSGDTCYLKDKLNSLWMPELHSVFSDPLSGQVVFVGLKLLKDRWHGDEFSCEFPNGHVSSTHVLQDERSSGYFPQYVVVLTCPIPNQYRWNARFQMNLRRLPTNTSYVNLTVCTSGGSPDIRYDLAICTMVKNADDFIPEWLTFHRFVGVKHVFIYDNERRANSTLSRTLSDFIEEGFVTIIPWAHSISPYKTYLEVQIAHENDCIWRHKHDVDWMIKIDVDEYIQPMNINQTSLITDYLQNSIFDHVAAVRIQNWFFGHPPDIIPHSNSVIRRNRWRSTDPTPQNTGHDKNILRPINVHYFKIHSVKLGGDVISADPHTELRLVHYRNDNSRVRRFSLPDFSVKDDSMVDLRNAAWTWQMLNISSSEESIGSMLDASTSDREM